MIRIVVLILLCLLSETVIARDEAVCTYKEMKKASEALPVGSTIVNVSEYLKAHGILYSIVSGLDETTMEMIEKVGTRFMKPISIISITPVNNWFKYYFLGDEREFQDFLFDGDGILTEKKCSLIYTSL